jgi:hypothetical protein
VACHKKYKYNLPQSKHILKRIFKEFYEDAEREEESEGERMKRRR